MCCNELLCVFTHATKLVLKTPCGLRLEGAVPVHSIDVDSM